MPPKTISSKIRRVALRNQELARTAKTRGAHEFRDEDFDTPAQNRFRTGGYILRATLKPAVATNRFERVLRRVGIGGTTDQVKALVNAVFDGHQRLVRAGFGDPAVMHDHDTVGVANRRQPVRDCDHGDLSV